MTESTPAVVRDSDFFLDSIFIRVEDAMFKIPKYYVTKISIFSTAFSLPPSKNGVEGLTEDNPLILHQISKVDFKAFLRVLVPLQVPPNYSGFSEKIWLSTLKLSTMWEVTTLRNLAMKNLNKLREVDMILFGTEYRIPAWFIIGCSRLIMRKPGPTEEECNRLGIGFVVEIYGLREKTMSHLNHVSLKAAECQQYVQKLVQDAFPDRIPK